MKLGFVPSPCLGEAQRGFHQRFRGCRNRVDSHRSSLLQLEGKRGGVSRLSRPVPPDSGRPRRPSRVAEQIRRDLAEIFLYERVAVQDSERELVPPSFRTRDISVLEVSISPDLRSARVEVSTLGGETTAKSCVAWLTQHRWEIRRYLAQKMRHQKSVPELHFRESRVPQVMRTLQLIDKLATERREGSTVPSENSTAAPYNTSDSELDDDADIRPEELFLLAPPAKSDSETTD